MILISLVFLPKITHSSQTYNQRMIYYICYYVHDINQAFSPSKLHGTAAAMAARRDGRAANQRAAAADGAAAAAPCGRLRALLLRRHRRAVEPDGAASGVDLTGLKEG